jgi:hypothetical protein
MLKGLAQDYFYTSKLLNHTFEDAYINICNFFKGPGFHRRNLDK